MVLTDVRPVRYNVDSATPQAQDLEDMLSEGPRLQPSSAGSLESTHGLIRETL